MLEQTGLKRCNKCCQDKPLGEFGRTNKNKTGRKNICLECGREYSRNHWYSEGKSCPECNNPIQNKSEYCTKCLRKIGKHPNYKGGKHLSKDGYVILTNQQDHPNVWKNGHVSEHIIVMSNYLGRPLTEHETVHHINTDRSDNRIENLQLRIGQHGQGGTYKCSDCGSRRIEPTKLS